jgi:hypothetical protein
LEQETAPGIGQQPTDDWEKGEGAHVALEEGQRVVFHWE